MSNTRQKTTVESAGLAHSERPGELCKRGNQVHKAKVSSHDQRPRSRFGPEHKATPRGGAAGHSLTGLAQGKGMDIHRDTQCHVTLCCGESPSPCLPATARKHTHTCTHVRTHTHTHMHAHMHTHEHAHSTQLCESTVHSCVHTCVHACAHIHGAST